MEERRGEHPYGDLGQLILLGLFLAVWLADSFFLRRSTFLSAWVPLMVRLALLALAAGCGLTLLRKGNVVVRDKEPPDYVVCSGPFRYVRHPLYLAMLLIYLGLSISTFSLLCFGLVVPIFVFYEYIAGYEEKLLEAKFGEAYRDYKRKTGKWLPRL